MIGWETILFVSVVGMFLIVLRRLPEAIRDARDELPEIQPASQPAFVSAPVAAEPTRSIRPTRHSGRRVLAEPSAMTSSAASVEPADQPVSADRATAEQAEEFYRAGRFPEARQAFEDLLSQNQSNEQYYQRLGMIYLQLEQFHAARDVFRAVLKFNDQVASRHAHLAMAEYALGHRLTAVRYIKRAIALAPSTNKYQELLETFESDRR